MFRALRCVRSILFLVGKERADRILSSELNCTCFLCLCLCSQQADLALQEAIRIAQEANDHVCLQHCLVGIVSLFFFTIDICNRDASLLKFRLTS